MEHVLGLVLSVLFYLSILIRWVARVATNYKQYELITGNGNFRRLLSKVGTEILERWVFISTVGLSVVFFEEI